MHQNSGNENTNRNMYININYNTYKIIKYFYL